ncbi:MAG: adenylate/guanylate cyclase domain-containing protein [Candidatus Nitrosotenuis sp.]|uniref:Adenylate/guanylate cyclase n=1 Tax=Candidatus Nitrosotenuis uzonensis TaxID=1407055 RepID=A0A812F1W8_9ARCH|nr:adenylate/guanylate cyclase domain-containing protein [Candidatus Nitrosotenuis uzonensis]CAE6499387.1 Adenylate/guanylate cyclase [Candidatus Nitrosotenuis uzonensis]
MSDTKNNPSQNDSLPEKQIKTKKDYGIIDMMLSQPTQRVVDSETLIKQTQNRVWRALKSGYEYSPAADESDKFLRKHVSSRMKMVVLYVDLVGSTNIALELPEDKVAIIITCFAQEMASTIRQHSGYVLKFVGDAVIGYFPAEENQLAPADNAVLCGKSMISVIQKGINPILNQYDYPDLAIKVGIDYGENMIVRYGSDAQKSHVDILGPTMNIAAKIQNMAKPNQILIGDEVYTRIHPSIQSTFEKVVWKNNEWKYRRSTGDLYPVYAYVD